MAGFRRTATTICLSLALVACSGTPPQPEAVSDLNPRVEQTFLHAAAVRDVEYSADGQRLATASADGTVKVWRVGDGALMHTLAHPSGVTSIAFSPDGEWLATGAEDGKVRRWRVDNGTLVQTLAASSQSETATPAQTGGGGHQGSAVRSVAVSADGQQLAAAGDSMSITVWHVPDGAMTHTLRGHTMPVSAIGFSPDRQLLARGSLDQSLRLWRLDGSEPVRSISRRTQAIETIAFGAGGELLASGGDAAKVLLWEVGTGWLVRVLDTESRPVHSVAFSGDGQFLAAGTRDKSALGELVQRIFGARAAGGRTDTIRVWRVRDGAPVASLAGQADDVTAVRFSPDGRRLASGSADGTVLLWRLRP
jgi:WD40 repeat protein